MVVFPLINNLLSLAAIIGQIIIVFLIVSFFATGLKNLVAKYVAKYAMHLSFAVALGATTISLFYSEFAGYAPCALCWFQRIFMYPQVILLGVALKKKDRSIIGYSIILSAIGAFIAAYHYLLQISQNPSLVCSATEVSTSCSQRAFVGFGYVTIPLMSLTAFLMILVFMIVKKISDKAN